MESPMKQAAKLLQNKKGGYRKLAVFLCLALLVTAGTVTAFVLHGQAQEHTRRVLQCTAVHQHTEDCYPDGDISAEPVCGLADFVVHTHNDDCYNEQGELVCTIGELEAHTHSEEEGCYTRPLICGLEEIAAHAHTADCYAEADKELACGQEERPAVEAVEGHTHTEACYEIPRTLICGEEERPAVEPVAAVEGDPGHAHSEACYDENGELVCGEEERDPVEPVAAVEGDPGHTHTDECYSSGEPVLVCGKEEAEPVEGDPGHTHTPECYTVKEGALPACGLEETEGHTHTEECYGEPELICQKAEIELHTHTDECYETHTVTVDGEEVEEKVLICGKLQIEEHTHTEETCFVIETLTPEEVEQLETETQQPEVVELQQVYEDENLRVIVDYDSTALLPEDAAIRLVSAAAPQPVLDASQMVVPEAPAEPAEGEPAEPAEGEPAEPAEGEPAAGEPTGEPEPAAAGEPSAPAEPETPTEPEPSTPAEPETPTEPEPSAPAEPETPAEPEPSAPTAPETPAEPEPSTPAAPETPTEPEPSTPTEPETPAEPEPSTPAEPAEGGADLVRAGFVAADGREWLPASTVTYTVQYLLEGQPAGEPVQYTFTPGSSLPSFAAAIARFTQTVETDEFIVTASYTALANLPAEAQLRASLITGQEQLDQYTAQYREAVSSSKAQLQALLDIGFWVGEGEQAAEVQPAAPVAITVQLLGEDGLPAGAPLMVVHFGQNGAEVIESKADEEGAAAFKMNSFSPVGIGQVPESDEEGRALLGEGNGTFEWTDPNGLYHVTFQVNGVIAPKTEEPAAPEAPEGEPPAPEGEGETPAAPETPEGEEGETPAAPETPEGEPAGEPEGEEGEEGEPPATEGETPAAIDTANIPVATASLLSFTVETVGEEDAAYAAYLEAAQSDASKLLDLAVLRYSLTYGGVEMDLSNCEITVTINPTMQMQAMAQQYTDENPVDNGDDDGDGYVQAADGESMLPAPEVNTGMLFSVSAPAAGAEQPVAVQSLVQLEGANAAPAQGVQAVSASPVAVVAADLPETGEELLEEPAGVEVSAQELTFTIAPKTLAAPAALDNTLGVVQQTETNPRFTVQYYARLPIVKQGGSAGSGESTLQIINTDGRRLPKNGEPPASTNIYLKDGTIVTKEKELTEVYRALEFDYLRAPELIYTNALLVNEHYHYGDNAELWVLKPEKNADSTDQNDWVVYTDLKKEKKTETTADGIEYTIYTYNAKLNGNNVELSFTNNTTVQNPIDGITYIPVQDSTVVRWVYQYSEDKESDYPVTLYDYDISNGWLYRRQDRAGGGVLSNQMFRPLGNGNGYQEHFDYKLGKQTIGQWVNGGSGHFYLYTNQQGINSDSNYSGTGTHLAFGNRNTGTNLGDVYWNEEQLNKYNEKNRNDVFKGCTFGLVTGLDGNGYIQYAPGVVAPKLFNEEGAVTGKTLHSGHSLRFTRQGDTYTLTAVRQGDTIRVDRLDHFNNPVADGTTYTTIWTNNFWPMDFELGDLRDAPFGGTTMFNENKSQHLLRNCTNGQTLPQSDDGKYHNSYFGMHYELQFELSSSYVGPLEYYFFGDDDMWVFLDGTLVCDIGGVHSSVGEYVNLWDYIAQAHGMTVEQVKENRTKSETHTLSFFYTERGASGSTCWMQFTLPSLTALEPEKPSDSYGSLRVEKTVQKVTNDTAGKTTTSEFNNGDSFSFKLELKAPDGATIPDWFNYTVCNADGTEKVKDVIGFNNGVFTLSHGEHIKINNLPIGTTYKITEIRSENPDLVYDTSIFIDGNETSVTAEQDWKNKVATGTILTASEVRVRFVNTYQVFSMPKTGGMPSVVYTGSGAVLVMLAAAAYAQRRRKKTADSSAK